MKLILLELNEINFDAIQEYINNGESLEGFKSLFELGIKTTFAEEEYDHLEPWIQWASVHTGKTFKEHGVRRLGDFVNSNHKQFFEIVEEAGFKVGAISPMNASNKLKKPSYFIPDPWTKTTTDGSFLSKIISKAVSQAVNDNSGSKITLSSLMSLIIGFFFFVNFKRYVPLFFYALSSIRKPWRKALFLDLMLYEIHKTSFQRKKPNFSTLFLNSGAHIQHHFFFNSPFSKSKNLLNPRWYLDQKKDPVLDMLKTYDYAIKDLLKIKNTELIIATGLSQKPFEKIKYYYRLKNHDKFLNLLDIRFRDVHTKMARDFLVTFDSVDDAVEAEKKLSQLKSDEDIKLFDEIDNRGKDLYIVLTYPKEIDKNTKLKLQTKEIFIEDFVNFVAIKNGEHQSKGFAYFSNGLKDISPDSNCHVSNIHNTVLEYFKIYDF